MINEKVIIAELERLKKTESIVKGGDTIFKQGRISAFEDIIFMLKCPQAYIVDTKICSQNEVLNQLNSALNSMEYGGHLPLDEDKMIPKDEIDSMAESISKDCKEEIDRQFDEITDKSLCGKEPEMVDLDDLPLDACKIQYPSREDGIKAHAEDYSWNIESELFQQLTPEQQKLWRKEIEQACISGGYSGLNLAKDPRYKENLEVKEVDEQKERMSECPYRQVGCTMYEGYILLSQLNRVAKVEEKQGEQKPQRMISAGAKEAMYDKPAWSEEDEDRLNSCVDAINAVYKWDSMIAWLKSLKDRVQPQSQWKPSDEQMNAFDAVLVYNPPCSNECRNHLITLYNELKKLKG